MKTFYTDVDLRSRKAMTAFLLKHFRYDTMSSWNQADSYACNLKIYRLGLERETENRLYDMLDTQEFFDAQRELLEDFGRKYSHRWQAAMNGRSGGYLVLYQGDVKPYEYRSYCTNCGQRNYRSIRDGGNICGVCGKPCRVDYTSPPMQVITYAGRGTDTGEDFEDWPVSQLRDRVRLVQDFDRLADRMVAEAVRMTKTFHVVEEEILVPKTRKILVSV